MATKSHTMLGSQLVDGLHRAVWIFTTATIAQAINDTLHILTFIAIFAIEYLAATGILAIPGCSKPSQLQDECESGGTCLAFIFLQKRKVAPCALKTVFSEQAFADGPRSAYKASVVVFGSATAQRILTCLSPSFSVVSKQ